jgi:hypothetical protein
MKPPDNASTVFRAVCSLVFSFAMLAGLPGIVAAQHIADFASFCSDADYQNTTLPAVQTIGKFTDVPHQAISGVNRQDEINRTDITPNCRLNFAGANNNNIIETWLTRVGAPGSNPPQNECWNLTAKVAVEKFNNQSAVGFVTNYNNSTKTGLFFGMWNGGSFHDFMALHVFNVSYPPRSGGPTAVFGNPPGIGPYWNPVASIDLTNFTNSQICGGGSRQTGKDVQLSNLGTPPVWFWYRLTLDICSDGTNVKGTGSWQPVVNPCTLALNTPVACPASPNQPAASTQQVCLSFDAPLSALGVSSTGEAGLLGLNTGNTGSGVDVKDFQFIGNPNPD